MEKFVDENDGGFFYTVDDHEALIARNKVIYDNATPSSSAVAATGLLRLGKLCGRSSYLQATEEVLRLGAGVTERSAIAGAQLLIALDMNLGPTPEIVILGDQEEPETAAILRDLRRRFVPNRVVVCRATGEGDGSANLAKVFARKTAQASSTSVFVCENFTCQAVPLPEGSGYLGFIFAHGDSLESVEAALRESHGQLEFVVETNVDPAWKDGHTSLAATTAEVV